ncbi:chaperone modulator CbpM [Dysgonomonas sp. 25]|uniref:chaperone modulator CbpM n=1 Tax=Dysgonomonas sp. 25 TaxID=2302933 RepID=UPI0013D25E63|nr:chaperone modulator CbpM [Dysgonomonas sp. 25]NDV68695.1 hypothetical protein [Dysgonomonas sp. 25]
MNSELIIIKEYCMYSNVEPEFIMDLGEEGLIEIYIVDNEPHIQASQLEMLERYIRWHYDLSVNVAGIDVIRNLLDKMDEMQREIDRLREIARLIG